MFSYGIAPTIETIILRPEISREILILHKMHSLSKKFQ